MQQSFFWSLRSGLFSEDKSARETPLRFLPSCYPELFFYESWYCKQIFYWNCYCYLFRDCDANCTYASTMSFVEREPLEDICRYSMLTILSTISHSSLKTYAVWQCCGSMTFWYRYISGSADPCIWLMGPDPDPGSGSCYFRHWPLRCQQGTFTSFFEDKKSKRSHKTVEIKVLLTIFAWW